MKMVKSLLLGSAAGFVAVAGAQAADLPVKAKPVEYVKICPLYGAGYWYVPGTDTCLKLGAYIRFQVENDASGGLPFMTGAGAIYTRTDTNNLNSRIRGVLTWDSRTQTEYGTLRGYIRGGWEQTTSVAVQDIAVAPFMDRAFIQFAGFTVGLADSFFDHLSLAPYSYANNSRINGSMGATGQLVFAYTAQLGNGFSATLSLEDGCNEASGPAGNAGACRGHSSVDVNTGAFSVTAGTVTVDNGSSFTPDIIGNIRVDQAWGTAQLSGAVHVNSAGYYTNFPPATCGPLVGGVGTGNTTRCDNPEEEIGWAIAGSIIVNLPQLAKGDTFGVMATFGEGANGYPTRGISTFRLWTHGDTAGGALRSIGFGLSGDSIFANPGTVPGYGGDLLLTTSWSVNAAFQHFWTPQLRTSLYGGYAAVEFSDEQKTLICGGLALNTAAAGAPFDVGAGFGVAPRGFAGVLVTNCDPDYQFWAVGSRTQWNPHPYLDIGVDVLWSHLATAFEGVGAVLPQGARTAGPVMIEDQDVLTVMGRIQYNFLP
jgi:hypothetical protein